MPDMVDHPLRVALVGLRGINDWFYRPALQRSAKATLVAGIDPADEARTKFSAHGPTPLYSSLQEALNHHALDAVVIGTPNHIHLRSIQEAAAAGLHMCVTKPLANNLSECAQAIDIARRANVLLQVGHEFRFRPAIREAIHRLRHNAYGSVSMAAAHMGHTGGLNPKLTGPATWRNNPANCPGGCANMLSVHTFDACNALFGMPRRVTASLRHLYAAAPMEDTATITIEYDAGTAVNTASYVSPQSEQMRFYAVQANLVAHEKGLLIEKSDGAESLDLAGAPNSADVLMDQLHDAVRLGITPATTGHEGLLAVAILEAAILSTQQHRTIDLEEVMNNISSTRT